MQNEQFPSQPKRLRSETKAYADNSSNTSFAEEAVDGGPVNKRETIDNLINTLQRLRDDDNPLGPSTVDLLNLGMTIFREVFSRGYGVQSSTATTSDLSNQAQVDTRIVSSWRDGNLHGLSVPYLLHQRQLCSSFAGSSLQEFSQSP
ncbi:hypothetical protein OSTOST_21071, partial [Ostertagia ostertagi]